MKRRTECPNCANWTHPDNLFYCCECGEFLGCVGCTPREIEDPGNALCEACADESAILEDLAIARYQDIEEGAAE